MFMRAAPYLPSKTTPVHIWRQPVEKRLGLYQSLNVVPTHTAANDGDGCACGCGREQHSMSR